MAIQKNKNPGKSINRHPVSEKRKQGIKILLAEDDVINQKVVTSILGRLGYSVDIFINGKDAVKSLEQTPYDLVLMDLQMPEMDGYKATEEIRNPNSKVIRHNVPVIALTGNAMEGDKNKFINAGMNDYLSKPVKPEELSAVIERWVFKNESIPKKQSSLKATEEDSVFDQSVLMGNFSNDKELISNMLNDYLNYLPKKIMDLKKAYNNGDASSLQYQAHTLKGSSANIGATGIYKIVHQIEIAGENGNLKGVDSLFIQLHEQLLEFKKAITRFEI